MANGATLTRACEIVGVSMRSIQRWRKPEGGDDRRAGPKSTPKHALTPEERREIVSIATSKEYRNLSPRQIVPLLADKGQYAGSESSFYRVLHEENLMAHRSHSRPANARSKPKALVATGPCQVWTWDITYLRSPVNGRFFYLYLIVDLWSRKVVAWRVHDEESMELAATLAEEACRAENVAGGRLTLHADNGGPMKGSTMLATLQKLGVVASFSRPGVSDDNAFCEALFRTLKYRPGFPRKPFPSLEAARGWVAGFVRWYNDEHLHSAIKYVTPSDRHAGRDKTILTRRDQVYAAAKARTPRRWTGDTRDWTPITRVTLNPERSAA